MSTSSHSGSSPTDLIIPASEANSSRESHWPLQFRWLGEVPFEDAWQRQVAEMEKRRASGNDPVSAGASTDVVLLLTHPSVYTAGRMTKVADLPDDGSPVVDVNRGGSVTWHGPGQLVGYPIIKLATPLDVMSFVHRTEDALICTMRDWGLPAGRILGRSGVWLPSDRALGTNGTRGERKICALGYHLTKGISQHGFAVNCNNDLTPYERIIPCGITDASITTMSVECGYTVQPQDIIPAVEYYFELALAGRLNVPMGEIPRDR